MEEAAAAPGGPVAVTAPSGPEQVWRLEAQERRRLREALQVPPGARLLALGREPILELIAPDPLERLDRVVGAGDDAGSTGAWALLDAVPDASLDGIVVCLPAGAAWQRLLANQARALRRGGRLGLFTCLAASGAEPFGVQLALRAELGFPPPELAVPRSMRELSDAIAATGLEVNDARTHMVRMRFPTGLAAVAWLHLHGIVADVLLERGAPEAFAVLLDMLGRRLDAGQAGLAFDIEVAAVLAARPV